MDAVAAFDAFQHVGKAGIVLLGVDQVKTGLVNGDGIEAGQHADIRHAGVFRHRAAVAVHGQVFHHTDVHRLTRKALRHGGSCICHGFQEAVVIALKTEAGVARAVNMLLAVAGSNADGQLLDRAAEAAHGVPLEVAEHQQGVVVSEILADEVLLDHLAAGNEQLQVGAFAVHDVHVEMLCPAVFAHQLLVAFGYIARARIGGVALHDGAFHMVDHRLPEVRAEEVLIALLAGVELHGHLAGQVNAQQLIHFQHLFRCDGS